MSCTPKFDRLTSPNGRMVIVTKAKDRATFTTGDMRVFRAHCGDDLSNTEVSVRDHWGRPSVTDMLAMVDERCNQLCVRGLA